MIKSSIVQKCFDEDKVFYTTHARGEMQEEKLGIIIENEVYEAILNAEIIEKYEDDQPYPSALFNGKTQQGRPLHIVIAHSQEENLVIVITVYQPDPERWIDYRRRKK